MYLKSITWSFVYLKILWREWSWDLWGAKKYGCKINKIYSERMKLFEWMIEI